MPRQSAAVYRRRRLVALLALILFAAVIGVAVWLLVACPWADAVTDPVPVSSFADASGAPDDSGATSSAEPSTESGIVACQAKDIVVTPVADADTYDPGALPQLSISLTNNGSADCTLDVGSATQIFTVSSGSDVWWRSTDCQEKPSSMIATLTAGATVTSKVPVAWDRTRSSVETCDQESRPRVPGGGASYHVAVEIGGFPGAETKQIILN